MNKHHTASNKIIDDKIKGVEASLASKGTGKNPEIVKFTEEQLSTKPLYSRDPEKWQKKVGKSKLVRKEYGLILIRRFLQIEFLILEVFPTLNLLGW
ncbi:TPA: hypothetical protein QCV71_005717 [Bacillus cereus]|nr:hypothetical protein [Bacillus cereus]HDX9500631.1 hypothetical protein [Bacillus thuringiensis]GMB76923.1 hypothetical protein BCER1_33240 [Bacillus cereus]HDR6771192.1 hypothetical protein [Bacillus cereus]HDR8470805.1 hypothetical protein [Bacillus cereus]